MAQFKLEIHTISNKLKNNLDKIQQIILNKVDSITPIKSK